MRKLLLVAAVVLLFSIPVSAHSGGTDSQGGHRDNKNVSGLGPYHFHHGMGAHLHPGGVCPYSAPAPTYTEPEPEPEPISTGLEHAYEEDVDLARRIGYEEYGDYNFFSYYDPDLEVFFNDYGDIYLDVTGEAVVIGEGFGEILSKRGYQYSEDSEIWYDDVGYYYAYSWKYVTWDELEKEMEEAGVYICDECENVIADSGEDHSEYCANNPAVIEAREAEEREKEEREDAVSSLFWSFAFIGGFIGIGHFIDWFEKRK